MQEPAKALHSKLISVHHGSHTTPRSKPPSNILKPLLLNRLSSPRPNTPDWKQPSKCTTLSGKSFSIAKSHSSREYKPSKIPTKTANTSDSSFCKLRFTPSRDGKRLPHLLPTKHVVNIRNRSRCNSMQEIKPMDTTFSKIVKKSSENSERQIKKKTSVSSLML